MPYVAKRGTCTINGGVPVVLSWKKRPAWVFFTVIGFHVVKNATPRRPLFSYSKLSQADVPLMWYNPCFPYYLFFFFKKVQPFWTFWQSQLSQSHKTPGSPGILSSWLFFVVLFGCVFSGLSLSDCPLSTAFDWDAHRIWSAWVFIIWSRGKLLQGNSTDNTHQTIYRFWELEEVV